MGCKLGRTGYTYSVRAEWISKGLLLIWISILVPPAWPASTVRGHRVSPRFRDSAPTTVSASAIPVAQSLCPRASVRW